MKKLNELIKLDLINGKIDIKCKIESENYIKKSTIADFLGIHINDVDFERTFLRTDSDGDLELGEQMDKEEVEKWLERLESMLIDSKERGDKNYELNEAFVNKFNNPKTEKNG